MTGRVLRNTSAHRVHPACRTQCHVRLRFALSSATAVLYFWHRMIRGAFGCCTSWMTAMVQFNCSDRHQAHREASQAQQSLRSAPQPGDRFDQHNSKRRARAKHKRLWHFVRQDARRSKTILMAYLNHALLRQRRVCHRTFRRVNRKPC